MVTVGYRTESIYRQYSIADSKLLEEATVELAALQSERDRRDRRVCGRVAERGIRPMHYEDAMKFLIEKLAGSPNIFADASRLPNFDVFIPSAITGFLREQSPRDGRLFSNPDSFRLPEFDDVWLAFYDAASELCRRGIFRLGEISAKAQGAPRYTIADGYSITATGREWLRHSTTRYVPTTPGRYLQCFENPGKVLGLGFLQRAGEAAGCHAYENHLACCAMCGAAAESALLAIANAKTDDPERVQREYNKRDGRRNVTNLIFGSSQTSTIRNQFESDTTTMSPRPRNCGRCQALA